MNDIQIQCFLAAAETSSYTKAARILCFTPQRVSQYVHTLEQEVRCPLILRKNHRLELTEAGQAYRRLLTEQQAREQTLREEVARQISQRKRQLRVAYSRMLSPYTELQEAVCEFQNNHLEFEVCCFYGDTIGLLRSGQADAAFLLSDAPVCESEFCNAAVAKEKTGIILSPWVETEGAADRSRCWGVPVVGEDQSEGADLVRTYALRKLLEQEGIVPPKIELLPTPHSVVATVQIAPCVTIGGFRFGVCSLLRDCRTLPLSAEMDRVYLRCLWNRQNENSMAAAFSREICGWFSGRGETAETQSKSP